MAAGPAWPVLMMCSMACLSSNFVKVKDSRCLSTTTLFFSMLTGDWRSPPQLEWGSLCQWDGLNSDGRQEQRTFISHKAQTILSVHASYRSGHRSTTQGLENRRHVKWDLSYVSLLLRENASVIWCCGRWSYSLGDKFVAGEAKTVRLLSFCVGRYRLFSVVFKGNCWI